MKLITRQSNLRASAFTLVETLISTTIVSTALLSVLGLLSSGMGFAAKCKSDSAAAILARRVALEVRLDAALPAATKATAAASPVHPVKLFDAALRSLTCQDSATQDKTYSSGSADLAACYLVTWKTTPRDDLGAGMKSLSVSVESPAAVMSANRRCRSYDTLLPP